MEGKTTESAPPSRRDVLFGREPVWWLPGPVRGAAQLVYLAASEFKRNRCPEKAAALAYETTLSFVPAIVLGLFLLRSFGGLQTLSRELPAQLLHQLNIDEIVLTLPAPEGAEPGAPAQRVKLSDKIQELAESADKALRSSGASALSLAGLALAAISLALTLEQSLNDIWGSGGRRRLLLRVALAWTLLTLGPLVAATSLALTRGLSPPAGVVDFAVGMAAPFVVLSIVYKLVPAADVSTPAALAGAVVSSAAWVVARRGWGLYLRYAGDNIYGALGLLPIGLVWVWLGWTIVLTGGEFAYTLENLSRLTAIERRRRLAPFVGPGMTALALVLRVGQAFRDGEGPVSGADVADAAGLPDHLWNRLVGVLLERKLLAQAGENGRRFAPGRPLEQLPLEEVFSAVEESLQARAEDAWPEGPNPLTALEAALAAARHKALGGRTIAQLLDESPTSLKR